MFKKFKKYTMYSLAQIRAILPSIVKKRNKDRQCVLVLASAHKVGSTWVYKMIKGLDVFQEWPVKHIYRANKKNHGLIDLNIEGVDGYLHDISSFRLFKSHSGPPSWNIGNDIKFVTVIRDPRDVVISNIFYLANLDSHLGGWPEMVDLSMSERISLYLKKGTFDLELLERWSTYENCHSVKYEDLLSNTEDEMIKLFKSINIDVTKGEVKQIVDRNSFAQLSSGRKSGKENSKSFFRKGVAGDWKNYFGSDEKNFFKTVNNGRWNKLLVSLNYETDENW